ncbi:CPBP family intramembrane metalloprotease [Flammeovirga kamogawensis]|uniref:CPBP family intramembrane metalloprotease n=1 Tax=Flammeovirga kamogawensis TaxID=373891 RepID=A0ABX8GSK0_9BACT|nr:CPBP family intramembrane metalloprotease [Flammeovirga kamogawensis]
MISILFNYQISFSINIPKNSNVLLLSLFIISFQIGIHFPLIEFTQDISTNYEFSPLHLIGALILAPIFEEYIFRGIILNGLLSKFSNFWAIVITNVIFCIIHLSVNQFFGALFLGIFISLVFIKNKSLGTCIYLHFLSNTIAFLHYYLNINYSISILINGLFAIIFFTIIAMNIKSLFTNDETTC